MNNRLMAVQIKANDQYEFTLYSLHLKAGADPVDYRWRQLQTDVIKHDMEVRMKENPNANFAVLGDLNYTPKDKEYPYFMASGTVPLHDAFENYNFPPTHPSTGPRRDIDHIFFNDGMLKEMVPDSQTVAAPLSLDEMSAISDHLPVVVSVTPNNL